MAYNQEVNAAQIITIGAVSGLLLIVIIIGLQAWFLSAEQRELAQYQDRPVMAVENLRLDQEMKINGYRWVDREKQIVAIPIEEAMKVIVANGGRVPATQASRN
jgi:hypothetical protein